MEEPEDSTLIRRAAVSSPIAALLPVADRFLVEYRLNIFRQLSWLRVFESVRSAAPARVDLSTLRRKDSKTGKKADDSRAMAECRACVHTGNDGENG